MDWQKHFAERSKETSRFGAALLQADDIDAINRYIVYASIKTKDAAKIKDEWIRWHDGLGWWSKNMDSAVYDEARNKRNRFNLANATSNAEKESIKNTQQTGLSTEEMQGGTRRVLSSGTYEVADEESIIPTSFKLGVGLTITTAVLGYVAYKFYSPTSWLKGFGADKLLKLGK